MGIRLAAEVNFLSRVHHRNPLTLTKPLPQPKISPSDS